MLLIFYHQRRFDDTNDANGEKPDVTYADIGGLDTEAENERGGRASLTHFELYKQIGIDPPRGVLMYGPPERGRRCLQAVANNTNASFIRVVGSEFVQKYLGKAQEWFVTFSA